MKIGLLQVAPAEVRFDARGIEKTSRVAALMEGVLAGIAGGMLPYFVVPSLQQIFQLAPSAWVVSVAPYVLGIVFAILVVLRPYAATHWLIRLDFRTVRATQRLPILWLQIMVVSAFFMAVALASGQRIPLPAIVNFLIAGFLLFAALHYSTRFYSAAAFARVYLLKFLGEREESDYWLVLAAKALNQALSSRGLRVRPYEFRAGVNLGLMRQTLEESNLHHLANSIVELGGSQSKTTIKHLEDVLGEVGQNARLLPLRPIRDRISPDYIAKTVTAIASIAAFVAFMLRLIFGIQIPWSA